MKTQKKKPMVRKGQEPSSPLFQFVLFVCGVGFLASILLAIGVIKIDFEAADPSSSSSTNQKSPLVTKSNTLRSNDVSSAKEIPRNEASKSAKHTLFEPFETQRSMLAKRDAVVDLHFIHIPKCGGTSMTAVLRQVACELNKGKNVDCCTNEGFCDWHAHRRCAAIKGCTDHFPQRPWIFKPVPSVTIFREPISRLLSAWFYRCHTPNNDCFQVRPYFKEIGQGKLPQVKFPEYAEMVEYQNIQTRMFGADSFPYRNVTVDDEVFARAVDALNHMSFVGLQEAYEVSVTLLLREMGMAGLNITVQKERDQSSSATTRISRDKKALLADKELMTRTRVLNLYDLALYARAVRKFCETLQRHPDLAAKVAAAGKVDCKKSLETVF